MDYTRIMAALRRRRWLILAGVLFCTITTALGSMQMKREFQASATLMPNEQALEPLKESLNSGENSRGEDPTVTQDRLKTVSTILTSPAVIGHVIQDLKLDTTLDVFEKELVVDDLSSRILRVGYRDEDKDRAVKVVNAIVERFVSYYSDLRTREARKQLELTSTERKAAERELNQANRRLEQFKRSRNISADLQGQSKELQTRASQLEADRNTAEARLRELSAQVQTSQAALARIPATKEIRVESTQTALVEKLKLDVAELQRALDKEQGIHTDEHPSVKRARQELDEARRRLDTESRRTTTSTQVVANPERETVSNTLRDLRREREGQIAKVASLTAKVTQAQAQLSEMAGVDVEQSLLQQRYTLAEQRLMGVAARHQQLQNANAILKDAPAIAVIDMAGGLNPPIDMSRGRTMKLTTLAFVLSLAACIALALALEMSDRRVRSIEEVETLTRLPVVSVVRQLPSGGGGASSLCLTTENDPASHLAESYHFLANHVLRQTSQRDSTVLMGATARPGQGATTALSNLAVALARAGRQVVLVEADLRRPFLHEAFECEAKPGLTDVLQDRANVPEALYPTPVANLRLMPAGSTVADPWSLLWRRSMGLTVQALRETADYVIFNVPSATVFADALCVAPHVDGAILVMRTSEMPNGAEAKVQQWFEEVNVPVMGVVLNGVPSKEMDTFEFHRSYTARRADAPQPALKAPVVPMSAALPPN